MLEYVKKSLIGLLGVGLLSGCGLTGNYYQKDVFDSSHSRLGQSNSRVYQSFQGNLKDKGTLQKRQLSNFAKKIRPNLCLLVSYSVDKDKDGFEYAYPVSGGNGFLINKEGYIITAGHLINTNRGVGMYAITFSEKMQPRVTKVNLVKKLEVNDIAVCKAEKEDFRDVLSLEFRVAPLLPLEKVGGISVEYTTNKNANSYFNINKGTEKIHTFPAILEVLKFYPDSDYANIKRIVKSDNYEPHINFWNGKIGLSSLMIQSKEKRGIVSDTFLEFLQVRDKDKYTITYQQMIPVIGKGEPGNSGSIVFDSKFRIIGVISANSKSESANQIYVTAPHLLRYLNGEICLIRDQRISSAAINSSER